jgi:predicted enzyme related to lactoylglutathione lyase
LFNGDCKIAAIWLYSKDPERAGQFYRDVLQMRQIEHGRVNSFDGGGLRLSIHPAPDSASTVPTGESFLAFYVKNGIEQRFEELKRRGVNFVGGIEDDPFGKTAHFKDPDGHEIFLWQPPPRNSANFKRVSGIVEHYESVDSRLAGQNAADSH